MKLLSARTRVVLIILIWTLAMISIALWFSGAKVVHLAIGGGPAGSESLALVTAVARVLNESHSEFRLTVFETGGSAQNIKLMQQGHIDFGTIQGDTPRPDGIQGIATLYYDAYHLIARDNVGIEGFPGLPGRRIAIPSQSSGAYGSFWFLADHYGIEPEALNAQPMSEAAADFAMALGQVDAVFRVRAPGNPGISRMIRSNYLKLVPIAQSEALALKQPAISPGVIPLGSYRGSPPLPEFDLPTAVLQRLLVARAELDPTVVYRITRAMFENRSEIQGQSRLAGFMEPLPEDAAGVITAHAGARIYYDREKPGLMQQNARLVSALISAFAVIVSGLLALRTYWVRSHRLRMHGFNQQLMDIAGHVREESRASVLLQYKHELMDMLSALVSDLEKQQVNQQEFEHFSFTWQAVDALVRDRITLLSAVSREDAGEFKELPV